MESNYTVFSVATCHAHSDLDVAPHKQIKTRWTRVRDSPCDY